MTNTPLALSPITAIEFYAGGGGFSYAFLKALARLGVEGSLLLAVNHDLEAIKTHQRNFPETKHLHAKVEQLVMGELCDAEVLFGSPECKWQTVARGKKQSQWRCAQPGLWTDCHEESEAEKSRASMWQMYEATKAKMQQKRPFKIVLVENVVEAATIWADHDDWAQAFKTLGYRHQELFLNAKFFGVPQNRDRYFSVFCLPDLPKPDLNFCPQAYCSACEQIVDAVQCWKPGAKRRRGKHGEQYDYRCPTLSCGRIVLPFFRTAASFLDFTDRGQPIVSRTKPLCIETLERIEAGLQRFCREGQPVPPEAYDIPAVLPRVLPFLVKYNSNGKAESIFQPLGTVSSRDRYGLVFLPPNWSVGSIPAIEDCSFRMLLPSEVQLAMCMQDLAIVSPYKVEIVKQCGLAVPPPLALAILLRLFPILRPSEFSQAVALDLHAPSIQQAKSGSRS